MYPLHAALHIPLASTSRASSDMDVAFDATKSPGLLAAPAVRVIQLVEMPAPPRAPRRTPPSSASASSSGLYSDSDSEDGFDDDEDMEAAEEYCSSASDLEEEEDEERLAQHAAEATKLDRILAWRAQFAQLAPTTFTITAPTPTSPTAPAPPLPLMSRKRSAISTTSTDESTPASKRSRTTATASASPAPSLRIRTAAPATRTPAVSAPAPVPVPTRAAAFLVPPAAAALTRRHSSPRHVSPTSLRHAALSVPSPMKHHRSASLTEQRGETRCAACDQRFTSVRAFRVHAMHPDPANGEGDEARQAACGAAVAYALEVASAMSH
ncbi:hypothetical protein GGX14DRAFT_582855 [Mycena pura]|uniref:Uncharacterized protein n=1 Tax=Mycena pura TaxID=153505 RepID=A0AAD7E6M8_9AGAR|nr:hypothetical protein GGX14DRAFT_582855 [Mycena pura]